MAEAKNVYLVIYEPFLGGQEREGYTQAASSQEAVDGYRKRGCVVKRVFLLTDMAGNWG